MLFLKFPDEQTGKDLLTQAGFTRDDPEFGFQYITATHDYALDVVGTVYRQVANTDPNATIPYDFFAVDGWHVNYIGTLPDILVPYQIPTPNVPFRIFAGFEY
jgi:hypothetical protein